MNQEVQDHTEEPVGQDDEVRGRADRKRPGEARDKDRDKDDDKDRDDDKDSDKDDEKKPISLQVQTPRGLWSETSPPNAALRPVYRRSTKIEQVVADARAVFKFTESDNQYVLLRGQERLEPQRTIASYHIERGTLLVLSVQGGNAS